MTAKATGQRFALVFVVLTLAGGSLLACGRGRAPTAEPERLAATPLPTLAFKQPTTMIQAAAEVTGTVAPGGDMDLGRGESIYSSKDCAGCHGPAAEGVAGKGKALAGTPLSEQEFTDVLRTGGKGELGNDHLYGPQSISPSGVTALYAYVKSLPAP